MPNPLNPPPAKETVYKRHGLESVHRSGVALWQEYLYSLSAGRPGSSMRELEAGVADEVINHRIPYSRYLTGFINFVGKKEKLKIAVGWHCPGQEWPHSGSSWPGATCDSWIYRKTNKQFYIVCHGDFRLLNHNDRLRSNFLLLHELWHLIDPAAGIAWKPWPDNCYVGSLDPQHEPSAWYFSATVFAQIAAARSVEIRTKGYGLNSAGPDKTGLELYPEWPRPSNALGSSSRSRSA
jgi:hypothetical protein